MAEVDDDAVLVADVGVGVGKRNVIIGPVGFPPFVVVVCRGVEGFVKTLSLLPNVRGAVSKGIVELIFPFVIDAVDAAVVVVVFVVVGVGQSSNKLVAVPKVHAPTLTHRTDFTETHQ